MSNLKKNPLLPLNTNTPKCSNSAPNTKLNLSEKENLMPNGPKILKSSSLQQCMNLNETDPGFKKWDPIPNSCDIWEFSDSEFAPASSWSTLPNRALLCRPLPIDVGKCTCIISKEIVEGTRGMSVYSLYTSEGQGRQDRKLAVAKHRRKRGKSEFIVAQNSNSIFTKSDDGVLGTITANIIGSKYQIRDQGKRGGSSEIKSKKLLGVVMFVPTITTLTGRFRSIKALVPEQQQSTQLKNAGTTQIQNVNGFTKDWEAKKKNVDRLISRVPFYNAVTKRYELDFRERAGKMGYKVQTSVKNFQLTMEGKGKQTILQLGRIGKSKYIMDFRYPLTGYQAFCICLASIDSKLCCSL